MRNAISSRRRFLKSSFTASSALLLSRWSLNLRAADAGNSPNNKLNLGIIGSGGRGGDNLNDVSTENIVALCDVDEKNAAGAFRKFPQAKRYQDFRVMLDKEKALDAVVVSTPDHIHAIAAITAMKLR